MGMNGDAQRRSNMNGIGMESSEALAGVDVAGVGEGVPSGQKLVVFTFDRYYSGTPEQVEASRVRLERALQVVCHDDDLALMAVTGGVVLPKQKL